jgi:hypothetical protein
MDCFAEPVIRRRCAPTGWLAMTGRKQRRRSPGERSDTRDSFRANRPTRISLRSCGLQSERPGRGSPARQSPRRRRKARGQSGVTMSRSKMRMTGQQSEYFFVYPFWLKWHDLISTHEAKKKQREEPASRGLQQDKKTGGEGRTWVNFWGR